MSHLRSGIRTASLVPVALVVAVAAGCHTIGPPLPSIPVVHNVQVEDIPVPQHFEFDERQSWAYTKFKDAPQPMRSCEMVYWGDRPVSELTRWYLEQMPLHGWEHRSTDQMSETRIVFTKGYEVAEITLKRTPDQDGRYYVTRLVARVGVR